MTSHSEMAIHAATNDAVMGMFSQNQYIVPFSHVVLVFPVGQRD